MIKLDKNVILNIFTVYIDKYQSLSDKYKKLLVYSAVILSALALVLYLIILHTLYNKNNDDLRKAEQTYIKVSYLSKNVIKKPNLEDIRNSLIQHKINIINLSMEKYLSLELQGNSSNIISWLQNSPFIIKDIHIQLNKNDIDKSIVVIKANLE